MNSQLLRFVRLIAAPVLMMLITVGPSVSFGQTQPVASLDSDEALALLKAEVGRWSGTRLTASSVAGESPVRSKVTVVNKIEAGKWLYFQVAETTDEGVDLSKGTRQFDPVSGNFVDRWFSSDDPEINSAPTIYDADDSKFVTSWKIPVVVDVDLELDGAANVVDAEDLKFRTFVSEVFLRDANTRVVTNYQLTLEDDVAVKKPISELILTRVKTVVKPVPVAGARRVPIDRVTAAEKRKMRQIAEDEVEEEKKKDPEHTLRVKVYVGSTLLKADQDPEIEISPDDAEAKRISASTFEFSELEGGVDYKITGAYRMSSGLRLNTAGKTSWEFSEDAEGGLVKTKVLRLEILP